jgi:acetyl-CoA acetyltransferase
MASEAVRAAAADAGISPSEIDGMLSYHGNDSTQSTYVASDVGARLNFFMDCSGGGSSTEALIGLAIGAIEGGMCETVCVWRSMNGYTQARIGGTGRAPSAIRGEGLFTLPYGQMSAAQNFAPSFMRHMYEYGTTSEQIARVKVAHSRHASNNPKAYYKQRVTVDDVVNSRWIVKPLHLLDCCVETDNATALIITSTERARDLRQKVTKILAAVGRVSKPRADWHWARGPITRVAGYYGAPRVYENAGVGPDDIDVTAAYDAFTFTAMLQLEEYGFCKKGEGGDYVSSGIIDLGGKRPNNTSGGQLCEGYTHGMNLVIENVRQLRGRVDDYCPGWADYQHSYDYEAGCRQVRDVHTTLNAAWANPFTGSAMVLQNE